MGRDGRQARRWLRRGHRGGLIVAGVGIGIVFLTVAHGVMTSVGPDETGIASGTSATLRELGGVLGVAFTASMFSHPHNYTSPCAVAIPRQATTSAAHKAIGHGRASQPAPSDLSPRTFRSKWLEGIGGATAVLDRDPTLLGERLDTGRATELAVTGVLHAAEGGHGLIGDALIVDVDDPGPDA